MQLHENTNESPDVLYDLQLIHKMCRGDELKIAKMIEVFISQTSDGMLELRNAYMEKDFVKIEKITHKIKPTLTYFGTVSLDREIKLLENMIENDTDLLLIQPTIDNINDIAQKVINEMKYNFNI